MMEHSIARDLLEGYVDGTLEPETARAVEVHLAECDECRALIEGVEPIRFDAGAAVPTPVPWGEDRFRKAVRRSLARIAFDLFSWGVIALLAVWLLSVFVIQSAVIDRGDRADAALAATWDLAVMLQPGAEVTEWRSNPGLLSRAFDVTTVLPIGGDTQELTVVRSQLGVWKFSGEHGGPIISYNQGDQRPGETLAHLPTGTVATVELVWGSPIGVANATSLMDTHPDVSVTWVGFPTGPGSGGFGYGFGSDDVAGIVGYGTCAQGPGDVDVRGSSMGSGQFFSSSMRPSVDRALDRVRGAMDNLLSKSEFVDAIGRFGGSSPRVVERAQEYLTNPDPGVASMVVTGPTDLVKQFVDDAGATTVTVRAVDLWNWTGPICGGR
jgi:hypothetical protein